MASANKFVDDMSRVFSGALGVAQGAKNEAETAMKGWFEKMVADRGFVTREEFEAVAEMAKNARAEVETLKAEIAALKPARKAAPKTTAKRAAAKKTANTTRSKKAN